jgi:SAM-dependent methyltransferase
VAGFERTPSRARRSEAPTGIARGAKLDYFEQLEALAKQQGGYFYPWRSALGDGNGEDAYTQLVEGHLSSEKVVLDAGCGHGTDMLAFAPKVRRFIGYDAVESFIAIARRRAAESGLANVELVLCNSSPRHNGGAARLPAIDHTLDLIISRRGPTNWIADARRACRPGARLIQINPLPPPETPSWTRELPEALRMVENPANPDRPSLVADIEAALAAVDVRLEDGQVFDVPEVISEPEDLYRCLTFMRFEPDTPSWDAARPHLQLLLARNGPIDLRQRRFLWTAVVD